MATWYGRILEGLIRLLVATFAAVGFESVWLNMRQLIGYLWLINTYRADANDLDDIYKFVITVYSWEVAFLVNGLCVGVVWLVGKILDVIQPKSMCNVLMNAFWLSALFYTLNLPIMICSNWHWQPYLHGHVNGLFKYFIISSVIYIHPGEKLKCWLRKSVDKKKVQ
ncbi:unnamed protein product [Soboliphyme baturini]|uniref:TLC domain-containing protein n=1 Tax=Soboliphyme baturini TaxID=241478 RepID=A0A183IQI8_9BILA|nr:unnamed protein product [Soboliphyme baturini]